MLSACDSSSVSSTAISISLRLRYSAYNTGISWAVSESCPSMAGRGTAWANSTAPHQQATPLGNTSISKYAGISRTVHRETVLFL